MRTKKPRTHFEQVPLEQVARLLSQSVLDVGKAQPLMISSNVLVERPDTKTEPYMAFPELTEAGAKNG